MACLLSDALAYTGRDAARELRNQVLARALRQAQIAPKSRPDIECIQRTVSDFFHIQLADLKSKKRTQRIAFSRQVAMYLCRKMTDSPFPTIGEHSVAITQPC